MRDHLKNAKSQNLNAKIKGSKLEIDGKLFTLKDLQKLEEEANGVETSESEEGKGNPTTGHTHTFTR